MVLMVRPKAWNTSTVIRIEIGIAVSEMSVARDVHQEHEQHDGDDDALPRAAPACTLSIDVSMNVA